MPDPNNHESAVQTGTLEEIVTPLSGGAPQLAKDAVVTSPDGQIRIVNSLGRNGAINAYTAAFEDSGQEVYLRETADPANGEALRQEAELLRAFSIPMFPRVHSCFELDARTILVSELVQGQNLADGIASNSLGFTQVLPILTQIAFAIGQLHEAGWVHLGLRPASVVLGKPARLGGFRFAAKTGTKPNAVFFHSGYSAPELLKGDNVDPRFDVFSLGALLYHALTKRPVSETGPELSSLTDDQLIPGLPQILYRCLGPLEARFPTAIELHRELVRLARRLRPALRFNCAGLTTIGVEPSRTMNQDAFGYVSGQSESEDGTTSWALVTVADGMGGMEAGEVASKAAVSAITEVGTNVLPQNNDLTAEQQTQFVVDWVKVANARVCDALGGLQGRGGCTLTCALLYGNRLTIGHVGDCRIYLIRNGEWRLLSKDHSLVMAMVTQGEIEFADIRKHPDRSNVTRSLGERKSMPDYFVDTLQQATGAATLELQSGDFLLLCTDGLWEPITETDITDAVSEDTTDLRRAGQTLIRTALSNGGSDNATAVLVGIE